MRIKAVAVLSLLALVAVLLVPTGASARRVVASGSLNILPGIPGGVLSGALVVTVLTVNTALDPAIKQGLPRRGGLYVAPFFVNYETTAPLAGDLDTILIMTNTTSASLPVVITVRANNGEILVSSLTQTLAGYETRNIRLSSILP